MSTSEPTIHALVELCRATHDQLQRQAARSVDLSLVVRSWLFGGYILELEGGGARGGELYGRRLFKRLPAELKAHEIKGTSPTNLRKCREFYQGWAPGPEPAAEMQQAVSVGSGHAEMQQTPSVESLEALIAAPRTLPRLSAELAQRFALGWSHYVTRLGLLFPRWDGGAA